MSNSSICCLLMFASTFELSNSFAAVDPTAGYCDAAELSYI